MYTELADAAVRASYDAYKNRSRIGAIAKKIYQWITEGRRKILVFGSDGVGKSTFGQILSGDVDSMRDPTYKSSVGVESYSLDGDVLCDVLVPPGESKGRTYNWQSLYDELAGGASIGVVNIVCDGFHSIADTAYTHHSLHQPGMSESAFLDVYREKRRSDEQGVIERIQPRLEDAPGKLWMLTLVTKQDLWWDRRDEVKSFYQDGSYGEIIRAISDEKGKSSFRHLYTSVSFILQNFTDAEGNMLATAVPAYDEVLKLANLEKLQADMKTLAEAKR